MGEAIHTHRHFKFYRSRTVEDRFEEFIALAQHHDMTMCLSFEAFTHYGHSEFEMLTDWQKEDLIARFEERLSLAMAMPRIMRQ